MGEEGQLFSFFGYSMIVYPITNYILSPNRSYSRRIRVLMAMCFLLLVFYFHVSFEMTEAGPNLYETLGVSRTASVAQIKRSFRNLSLLWHPDKNSDPAAVDVFNSIKTAHDVLIDTDIREVYNHLGKAGVAQATQGGLDFKAIFIQIVVRYFSMLIMTFVMTLSDPSAEATAATFFGMLVMFLVEYQLVLGEVTIPAYVFPSLTHFDLVTLLHRAFPAYMSGCRCIIGSAFVDRRARRGAMLQQLASTSSDLSTRLAVLVAGEADSLRQHMAESECYNSESEAGSGSGSGSGSGLGSLLKVGLMSRAMSAAAVGVDADTVAMVSKLQQMVQENPADVLVAQRRALYFSRFRDLSVYIAVVAAVHYFRSN